MQCYVHPTFWPFQGTELIAKQFVNIITKHSWISSKWRGIQLIRPNHHNPFENFTQVQETDNFKTYIEHKVNIILALNHLKTLHDLTRVQACLMLRIKALIPSSLFEL